MTGWIIYTSKYVSLCIKLVYVKSEQKHGLHWYDVAYWMACLYSPKYSGIYSNLCSTMLRHIKKHIQEAKKKNPASDAFNEKSQNLFMQLRYFVLSHCRF